MKPWWIAVVAVAVLAMEAVAQDRHAAASAGPDGQAGPNLKSTIQNNDSASTSNIEMLAELTKSVNATKVQAGDPVKAAVTQDVIVHGRIVVRRGSKLIGHVTRVKIRSKDDKESQLGVIFDRAVLKGSEEIGFSAVVQALAAPPPANFEDEDMLPPMLKMGRQQTGGPQRIDAPSVAGASRGTGLPSTDKPLDTSMPTTHNAPGVGVPYSGTLNKRGSGNLMGGGSRGVFGLPGLQLKPEAQVGSVVSSTIRNVTLDRGTQILLQVNIPVPSQ